MEQKKGSRKKLYGGILIILLWVVVCGSLLIAVANWEAIFPEEKIQMPISKEIEASILAKNAGNQILFNTGEIPAGGNPDNKVILLLPVTSAQAFVENIPANATIFTTLEVDPDLKSSAGIQDYHYHAVKKIYWTFIEDPNLPVAVRITYSDSYDYGEPDNKADVKHITSEAVSFVYQRNPIFSFVIGVTTLGAVLVGGILATYWIEKRFGLCSHLHHL